MKIAILFNGRPASTAGPDDMHEEYDTPDTIAAIAGALSPFGAIEPVEADRELPQRLTSGGFDIAFNIAEGHGRRCREAHAPAVCELLGVPYTHSDPLTLALTLDKMMARRVVSPDVPVATAMLDDCRGLAYPVIVKPNDEGSSKGIRDDSLAFDESQARRRIDTLRSLYDCPVLVEEFLPGPEVTIAVTGSGCEARVLGMMEIAPATPAEAFVYSVEAKRAFRERIRYFIPPRLPQAALELIESYAITAYRLLSCRDIARLDFRLNAAGLPHFLECNPLPGLNPDTSDLAILSRPLLPYQELVQGILIEALRRYGITCEF